MALPASLAVAPVVTVEQTGKSWKSLQMVGVVLMCVGTVTCAAHQPEASAGLWLGGFFAYVLGRVGAWWNHG
jgi:hypothetical protein